MLNIIVHVISMYTINEQLNSFYLQFHGQVVIVKWNGNILCGLTQCFMLLCWCWSFFVWGQAFSIITQSEHSLDERKIVYIFSMLLLGLPIECIQTV